MTLIRKFHIILEIVIVLGKALVHISGGSIVADEAKGEPSAQAASPASFFEPAPWINARQATPAPRMDCTVRGLRARAAPTYGHDYSTRAALFRVAHGQRCLRTYAL
jgi:hypothetical protein